MSEIYRFNEFYIPEYMMESLERYINDGVPPGHFLQAVIENDLEAAVARADSNNMGQLPAYVGYLYNKAPQGCWGYKGAVKDWCDKIAEARENSDQLSTLADANDTILDG
jgi:hypothetical protein